MNAAGQCLRRALARYPVVVDGEEIDKSALSLPTNVILQGENLCFGSSRGDRVFAAPAQLAGIAP